MIKVRQMYKLATEAAKALRQAYAAARPRAAAAAKKKATGQRGSLRAEREIALRAARRARRLEHAKRARRKAARRKARIQNCLCARPKYGDASAWGGSFC